MRRAGEARLVLLDASVPHRFCEAEMLLSLSSRWSYAARWMKPKV